jgi:hypothetical protein
MSITEHKCFELDFRQRTRHSAKTFVLAYKLLSFSMQSVTVITSTLVGALSSCDHLHVSRGTFQSVPTTTPVSKDFSSDAPLSLSLGYKRQSKGGLLLVWTPRRFVR